MLDSDFDMTSHFLHANPPLEAHREGLLNALSHFP